METINNIKVLAEEQSNIIMAVAELVGLAKNKGYESEAIEIMKRNGITLETEVV